MREPRLLTLEVCRRYHLDGWTKKAIADHLGLSRFQVARMLDRARAEGWVRIEIDAPPEIDVELGDRVRDLLDLRHVVVVRSERGRPVERSELAAAVAQLLESVLGPDDVLGLAWSRTIAAAVDRLGRVPRIPVVQLTGALPRPEESSSVELLRRFAATSGGPAYVYYAPTILTDERTATAMRAQPEVAGAIARLADVTVAAVAIGGWGPGVSTLHDALTPADRAEVEAHGVVGEVSNVLIGPDGDLPRPPLTRRMLCPSGEQLAAVPHVVAAVPNEHCAPAIRSAVASGLVDSLVISQTTAEDLLPSSGSRGRQAATGEG